MQNLLTPTNFDFFARYLLAGFILLSVRSWFVSAQRPRPTEVLFDAVILSLINQLVFLAVAPVVSLTVSQLPINAHKAFGALAEGRIIFFVEVLLLPSLLGALFGATLASGHAGSLLRRLAMPNTHPTERAYDFAFAQRAGPGFVIVTFKDGTVVHGFFGNRSLAASDEARSDIYLERLYSLGEGGQWVEADPPRSALLTIGDVRSVEFLATGGSNG